MAQVNLTISKTKKGLEYLGISFTDKNGKRHRKALKLSNTPANRKEVKNIIIPKMMLALEEKASEFFNNNKIPTVDEFVMKSINMHRSERNEATHREYISAYNMHIKDILGHIALDKVKVSDIKQWQSDLQIVKCLSGSRVKNIRKVLTRMYSDAIDDEIVTKSPLSRVPAPTIDLPDIQPFSADEVIKLISNAEGQLQNFVATACLTGARSGELLGLKWSDIDFTSRLATLHTTKNGKPRLLPLTSNVMAELNQFRQIGSGLIFNSTISSDKPYEISKSYTKALKGAGIGVCRFHDLRHTAASNLAKSGASLLEIAEVLGHSNTTITKRYAHLCTEHNKVLPNV